MNDYPLLQEYIEAIKFAEDNFEALKHLRPVLGDDGEPIMSSGNFAVVFKMKNVLTDKFYAIKCFLRDQEGREEAYRMISEVLSDVNSSYLTPITYIENELFVDSKVTQETEFPVLLMDWVEGKTLDKYIRENLDDQYALEMLAYQFSRLAMWLLPQPFAHGDLKPDNIIVREDGTLTLVDYDGMFVPAMKGQMARELGSPGFRHPSRTVDEFNEHIDDFPIASILLSLKAIALQPLLLEEYGASDRLLLSEDDYRNISQSQFFKQVFPSDNMELNKLMNLFMLALSENNLSAVSSNLFNLQKPEDVVYSTEVTEEDLANAWVDEYGVKYSADRKRLLKASDDLTNYTIRKGTVVICDKAFQGKESFDDDYNPWDTTYPDFEGDFEDPMYAYTSKIKEVIIPNTVKYIGTKSFQYCCKLSSIIIPNNVKSIGDCAFEGCFALSSIEISNNLTNISNCAFKRCRNLTSIVIPDSVTHIGDEAFSNCTKLTSIDIPNSVMHIGNETFSRCIRLNPIVLPESLIHIGDFAFYRCISLTTIFIPESVTHIGECVFMNCENLTTIKVNINNKQYDSRCNCNGIIESDTDTLIAGCPSTIIPPYINIGDYAFRECKGLSSLVIPDGVTSIGEGAFEDCRNLTSIIILNKSDLITIGDYAFRRCASLFSFIIPSGVKNVGNEVFAECLSLKNIIIPNSVVKIGNSAFNGCRNLFSISIPDSVKSIGNFVFSGCHSLKQLIIVGGSRKKFEELLPEYKEKLVEQDYSTEVTSDDWNNSWTDEFGVKYSNDKKKLLWANNIEGDYTILEGTRVLCDDSFSWNNDLIAVHMPDSVLVVGKDAFKNCKFLKNVAISNSIKVMDEGAFWGCDSLTRINIPKHLMKLGEGVFGMCDCEIINSSNLYKVQDRALYSADMKVLLHYPAKKNAFILPKSVTIINDFAFFGCASLSTISIPETIKYIGKSAFSFCESLKQVQIPQSVTIINSNTFSYCKSIESIIIPISVNVIGEDAFCQCDSLKSLFIPKSVFWISDTAFRGCSNLASIKVDSDNPYYDSRNNCNAIIDSSENELIVGSSSTIIPDSVKSIGSGAFQGKSMKSLTIPYGVEKIGEYAFCGCKSFFSLSLPNSISILKEYAFADCKDLHSIVLSENLSIIEDSAFANCENLSSITISGNVSVIGRRAFQNCIRLTSICINVDSSISVDDDAFLGCFNLKSVFISGITRISESAFYGCHSLKHIYIKKGCLYKYKHLLPKYKHLLLEIEEE